MFALFNANKNFIGYGKDLPDNPSLNILSKEIPLDNQDLTVWRWDGDFDDGKMVLINENPYPVEEIDFDTSLYEKIYNKYPIDLQLVILMKQVKMLSEKADCLHPEFDEMSKLILKAVENYEHERKFYLNNNE
jgi:hypothetical protein